MTGPGDEGPAGRKSQGHLRASHDDREQAVSVLKTAFVQGRLAKDEFDLRVERAFAARTYAELAPLTADLPAEPATARPLAKPAGESSGGKAAKAWACGGVILTGVSTVVAMSGPSGTTVERMIGVVIFVPLVALLVAMLVAWHAWLERRAVKRSAPGGDGPAAHFGWSLAR